MSENGLVTCFVTSQRGGNTDEHFKDLQVKDSLSATALRLCDIRLLFLSLPVSMNDGVLLSFLCQTTIKIALQAAYFNEYKARYSPVKKKKKQSLPKAAVYENNELPFINDRSFIEI